MHEFWQSAAFVSAMLFNLSFLSQVLKTAGSQNVEGISILQWIGFTIGTVAFLGFYIEIGKLLMAMASIFALGCCVVMLFMLIYFRKPNEMYLDKFDGLEVSPVQFFDEDGGGEYAERIARSEVDQDTNVVWSVYGHLREGHVECLKDFRSEKAALKYAEKLIAKHQNLSKYGILTY